MALHHDIFFFFRSFIVTAVGRLDAKDIITIGVRTDKQGAHDMVFCN